jgi:hypothetical protein
MSALTAGKKERMIKISKTRMRRIKRVRGNKLWKPEQ